MSRSVMAEAAGTVLLLLVVAKGAVAVAAVPSIRAVVERDVVGFISTAGVDDVVVATTAAAPICC